MPNNFFPSNVCEFIFNHNANSFLPLPTMPVLPNTDRDVKANDNERDEYDDFPNTRYDTDAHLDEVGRYEE